ncbi:urease accessory protein UreD [Lentzea sp. NBRC 105346]|uniref:urease accessory protein UreD n=1 Tax=Lentzea sp. NBRC 105346 TaxID=3032205 RepID=UPI0024A21C77|nr:urease accessory protein UreD [Lentzea sp. NBRC 105346]GLZ34370.1 urease accessory protein UreD [Lentzea sp. NBRC 105346]
MRSSALLTVSLDAHGNSVVRDLRSQAPLTLVPHRRASTEALVHLVSSVTAPLGGDDLTLTVRVGAGARLALRGVAATLALPGHRADGSRTTVTFEVEDGAAVTYLPEPTVVTARARHEAVLSVSLAPTAVLRTREVLVLGRSGEQPGVLGTTVRARRDGKPLLHQRLAIGDPRVAASPAGLAGKRVLGTDLRLDDSACSTAGGEWWSRVPLAFGGSLVTVLADDVVTATRVLDHSIVADCEQLSRSRSR